MRRMLSTLLIGLAFAVGLLTPDDAHARRRGFVLITHGETIQHVEEVPDDKYAVAEQMTGANVRVGYRYSSFGLFFLDIWTWDGEFVLYQGSDYWELDEETCDELLGKSLADLEQPWVYRYPPLLVVLFAGGLLLGLSKLGSKGDKSKSKGKRKGPSAFDLACDRYANAGENGLNAALNVLQAHGYDRETVMPQLMSELRKRGLA